MGDFQSGAIVSFGILTALMGVLELLVPSWLDSYQRFATDLTILFCICLVGLIASRCLTKSKDAR
jgi:hypothetical protein